MSNTDRVEWRLFNTDLTTQVGILPISTGHLYMDFQEVGSGEVRIPLDTTIAAQVTEGMFAMCYYRGAARGGFFVDATKKSPASAEEGAGRWLSLSGRGPLGMLDEVIIFEDGSGDSTRTFSATSKGDILDTLLQERADRGPWVELDWDFTASVDSDAVAWTDSEDIEIPVGNTLLEVLRDFASSGDFEFEINFTSPQWILSCRQGGLGTDKSETVFFRVGTNCLEVSDDVIGGSEIRNSYLVKFRDGYTTASDATSITNRRRREKFLNLDVAQSGASAQTFASAKLAETKDPKTSFSVRVYDGVKPYLFVDYVMGDTITLDRFGSEVTYRVLGIQADFSGDDYSNVVVVLNSLYYRNELRMKRDLDWLMKQWNTARDANQQEVRQWLSIGQPNGEVYALHNYGDYLYVGGNFTAITGKLTTSYIARYQISTGQWSMMGTEITAPVLEITNVGSTLYAAISNKVYEWGGSSWNLIGSITAGISTISTMIAEGTDLYVGFTGTVDFESITIQSLVAKYTGTWSQVGTSHNVSKCFDLVFYNSALHGGFDSSSTTQYSLQKFSAGSWSTVLSSTYLTDETMKLVVSGSNLIFVNGAGVLKSWDGVSASPTTIGTAITGIEVGDLETYLTDVFYGGDFTIIDSVSGFNHIGRYSAGTWSKLGSGADSDTNHIVDALTVVGDDLYVGGLFTNAEGISNLAVWVTSFESLADHLSHDNGFDLAAAIHQATASAITDNDEMGFWEDVSNALRKITWANIKATLKTYFDAIYAPVAKGVTNGDSHNHVGGDGAVLNHADVIGAFTAGATIPATTTYSNCPFKNTLDVTTNQMPWPEGGTLSDLSVRISTTQPGTGSLVATLYVNGSATSVVVTIAAGAAANTYTDSTHTATINAGEVIRWDLQNNATSASAAVTGVTVKLTKPTT